MNTLEHVTAELRDYVATLEPGCYSGALQGPRLRPHPRIECHHTLGFAEHHITSYRILGGVCPDHHDLITHRGYEAIDNDDGTWSLRAPPKSDAA
jgi:hypothetical protein